MKTEKITQSNFIRRSSLAAVLGGALYVATEAVWHPIHELLILGDSAALRQPVEHAIHHLPELPAYALLALGLVGLVRCYGKSLGRVGRLGLYLAWIGFALMSLGTLGIVLFEGVLGTSVDALETVHPLLLLPLAGSLLCGPAILKAKVLSPAGAWLIISAALMFLGLIFSGLIDTFWGYWVGKAVLTLFSAGWTWLGYALWSQGRQVVRPAGPVSQAAG